MLYEISYKLKEKMTGTGEGKGETNTAGRIGNGRADLKREETLRKEQQLREAGELAESRTISTERQDFLVE